MRIIAGKLGGRRLPALREPGVRPTSDRVREAIFSSLASRLSFEGKSVLDLYAGTGALGIEALSRGAAHCLFVERAPGVVKALRGTLENFDLGKQAKVLQGDVFSFLSNPKSSSPYDLIFADPPYEVAEPQRLIFALLDPRLVHPGSIVLLETGEKSAPVDNMIQGALSAVIQKVKRYGDTTLHIIEIEGSA